MRFNYYRETRTSKEELRRFDLIDNGFSEVVEYEDMVASIKLLNKNTKFPIHGQINFILSNSKDIYELVYNMNRYIKELKNEDLRNTLEQILKQYRR